MMHPANKHFRVTAKGECFRLTHVPSKNYYQRYLYDFSTRREALACRDRVIAAAPDWDWSDPGLCADMPTAMYVNVWRAIYADLEQV